MNGHEPVPFQRHGAGQPPVGTQGLALADQHQRQMREGGEIATRADRSTARDDRMDARVQQRDEGFERLDAYARRTAGEDVGPQRHRGAYGLDRQRIADACRVTSQQIGLERAQGVVRDAHVGKRSESGIDAIDGGVAVRRPIHDAAGRGDAGARRIIEDDASVLAGDRRELVQRERSAVEWNDHAGRRVYCTRGRHRSESPTGVGSHVR